MIQTASTQNTTNLLQIIANEIQGLSWNTLQEILDFVQFMKLRDHQAQRVSSTMPQELHAALRDGESDSLAHLEAEFADYKERYPHE